MSESTYIPGMCNINKAEVAYRRKAMWFGVALSVILFVLLLALQSAWWIVALGLFIPVYIAAIGYLQVKNKFCVSYGSQGKQNASDGNELAEAITDKEALAADKKKTRNMNLQALAITIVVLVVAGAVTFII